MKKFNRYDLVHVHKKGSMCHGSEVIIDATYGELFWGGDHTQYAVYVLHNGEVSYRMAWVDEDSLELSEHQDAELAKKLVDRYNTPKEY